jgi:hypothetical protein
MTLIQDLTTITTGTGTTGATILIGDGSLTGITNQIDFGGAMILGILILAGVIAHLLDRRSNQKLDLGQKYQEQDHKDQE